MAAALLQVKPILKTVVHDFFNKSLGFVRNSSKSSKGVGKSDGGRPSRFGIKKNHSSVVNRSVILYKQNRLTFAPGLNVGLGKIANLYAKVPGKVIISSENTNFKPDHIIVQLSFPDYPPAYRKYMNVIPEPLHRRFKLVEKF